jgi:hypothetical protein
MPFPMVHLNIARNILSSITDKIISRDFYIGSLAPDSVHFRPNYSGAYKVKSHICIDSWKWGESEDNDAWEENVIQFFHSNSNPINHSFLYGYCTHILADIAWNRKFWLPFRTSHTIDSENIGKSRLHQDCYEIDTHLYHQLTDKNKIRALLDNCCGFEINGIVSELEIVKMVKSLLHEQYQNRSINPEYEFRYININQVNGFIYDETMRIARTLFTQ